MHTESGRGCDLAVTAKDSCACTHLEQMEKENEGANWQTQVMSGKWP